MPDFFLSCPDKLGSSRGSAPEGHLYPAVLFVYTQEQVTAGALLSRAGLSRTFNLLKLELINPGIEPSSPTLQTDSLPSEPPGKSLW